MYSSMGSGLSRHLNPSGSIWRPLLTAMGPSWTDRTAASKSGTAAIIGLYGHGHEAVAVPGDRQTPSEARVVTGNSAQLPPGG